MSSINTPRKLWEYRLLLLGFLACIIASSVIAAPASAATLQDDLEKAIYTEETVGDLGKAIEAYKAIISDREAVIAVAAQAQFRIGQCYEKQGKSTDAIAAFREVIQNYPEATDWVTRAKAQLPTTAELMPVPWGDGDELQLEMKLNNGMIVGHQVFRVAKIEKEGRQYWECTNWQTVVLNDQANRSRVLASFDTFLPIESTWKHSMLGTANATFDDGSVTINVVGKDDAVALKHRSTVYDNEQAAEVFRRLPLKVGYQTELTVLPSLGGQFVPLSLSVDKVETVKVPAGEFECFKLKLNIGQTFWISNDKNRYIVRFDGGGVVADLTEIRQSEADKSTELTRESFSATLPPQWYAFTTPNPKDEQQARTWLVDPDAIVVAFVESGPVETVKKEQGYETARDWLEDVMKQLGEQEDFSIASSGIETATFGGHEGFSVAFEYTEEGNLMKGKRFAAFSPTSALSVQYVIPQGAVEEWEPSIEKIIASLKLK